ncbi:MAG: hypothetical protein KF721_04850 [Ignavibacteriaceae bacterium]|nr:hypothetical protein [Ignavibacteriaceae bacterium]
MLAEQLPLGYLDYGLAGALIIVIIIIFKFFQFITKRENERRDKSYSDLLNTLNENTKKRDDGYKELVYQTKEDFKRIITDLTRTIEKTDKNYSEAIDKFIKVIKEQNESNSYLVSELTKLQEKIENLSRNGTETKREILEAIKGLTNHFEMRAKT